MFLSRRGYHPHVNTACTCIKSSGFILTFEYLDILFNRTLDNELRFGHYFQSSAKIELMSSALRKRGAGNMPVMGATRAGRGAWGWKCPHLLSPFGSEGWGFSPQQSAQIRKGVKCSCSPTPQDSGVAN